MSNFNLTNDELSGLGTCVVCEIKTQGRYGTAYPICIECYRSGRLKDWQFARLLGLLSELEKHARLYGAVPKSADKLWRRVREAIAAEINNA